MTSWFGTDASHSNLPTTVCGSSSPPRTSATVQALAPDCAKKRWLRQAISEDSDSPKQGYLFKFLLHFISFYII